MFRTELSNGGDWKAEEEIQGFKFLHKASSSQCQISGSPFPATFAANSRTHMLNQQDCLRLFKERILHQGKRYQKLSFVHARQICEDLHLKTVIGDQVETTRTCPAGEVVLCASPYSQNES